MMELFQFEWDRRKKGIFGALALMLCMQLYIIYGIYKGGSNLAFAILVAVLLVVGGSIFVLIDSIRTHYSDLFRTEGYMVWLVPRNGFENLGAKMIMNIVELILFVLIGLGFAYLDINIFQVQYGEGIEQSIGIGLNSFKELFPSIGSVVLLITTGFLQWIHVIVLAILAITLTKTLFSRKKYSGVASFVVFIALNIGIQMLSATILGATGAFSNIIELQNSSVGDNISQFINRFSITMIIMYIVYISGFCYLSAYLVEKNIDL